METPASIPINSTRRRRARQRSSWASRIGIAFLILTIIGLTAFFGLSVWLKTYLQGDSFRSWLGSELSRRLEADAVIEGIKWQASSAWVRKFNAQGRPSSAFANIEATDIRTTINPGAIWDRIWQIDDIHVARALISVGGGNPHSQNSQPIDQYPAGHVGGGFLASLLPNRPEKRRRPPTVG